MKCLILLFLMVNLILAKQYERCELAKELYEKHDVASKEIGVLVCIAEKSSSLDTQSSDSLHYGLFSLYSKFWCSKDGSEGGACNMKCSDLIDDDITDDVKCVKNILLYQGLDAWTLTKTHCRSTSKVIMEQCFGNDWESSMSKTTEQTTTASSKNPENMEENPNEPTLTEDGTLVVELVDLIVDSIKSFDVENCHHKERPIINLTFNINGKDIKKIKIVGKKDVN